MKARISFSVFLAISIILISSHISIAQLNYPTRSIEVTYSYAAGSFGDVLLRIVAEEAKKGLGQEVVVTNKPGGAGTVAISYVSSAKPDGYTLGATPSGPFTTTPLTMKLSFDPMEVITPIVSLSVLNNAILVRPDSPFKSLKDLLQYTKQNPGKVSCGHTGFGSRGHLEISAILAQEKTKMNLVSFQGDVPGLTAILGGHITTYVSSASAAYAHIKSGKLRLLAVTEDERMDAFPDVPCVGEFGYPVVPPSVFIVYGPKNVPESIEKLLEDEFYKAANSPRAEKYAIDNTAHQKKKLRGKEIMSVLQATRAQAREIIQGLGPEQK